MAGGTETSVAVTDTAVVDATAPGVNETVAPPSGLAAMPPRVGVTTVAASNTISALVFFSAGLNEASPAVVVDADASSTEASLLELTPVAVGGGEGPLP